MPRFMTKSHNKIAVIVGPIYYLSSLAFFELNDERDGTLFQRESTQWLNPTKPLFRHVPISRHISFVKSCLTLRPVQFVTVLMPLFHTIQRRKRAAVLNNNNVGVSTSASTIVSLRLLFSLSKTPIRSHFSHSTLRVNRTSTLEPSKKAFFTRWL